MTSDGGQCLAERSLPSQPKIALLGDSVLGGLGVRGRSYGHLVGEDLRAVKVLGFARSGFTVLNAVGRLDKLRSFGPDLVIVGVGGSEALVHAPASVQRLLDRYGPRSWRGVDGLEPAVWLASGWRARFAQVAAMAPKLVVKHASIRWGDGYRRLPPEEYVAGLIALLDGLSELGCRVVVVGVHQPNRWLWPRSGFSCAIYEQLTYETASRYDNVVLVEPKLLLQKWSDYTHDHAHLSHTGHAKIAGEVLRSLGVRTGPH
jgi:lysophospholipase L1-like esterase